MDSNLIFGLQLSAIGLGVTFSALGVLIGVILLLLNIFPAESKGKIVKMEKPDEEDAKMEEMAAALAVGISILEKENAFEQKDQSLGDLLRKG